MTSVYSQIKLNPIANSIVLQSKLIFKWPFALTFE